MVNYDSVFNLSSGVTCNWCIQLDARQSLALNLERKLFLPMQSIIIIIDDAFISLQ